MAENDLMIYDEDDLKSRIYIIRGVQVMLDRDLAKIYGVETKRLNEQVKRNKERFPDDFCFQLNNEEFENWKSQNATSNSDKMGMRKLPYAFTEQGVSMLSSVLKTRTAARESVKIIRAFVAMRHFVINNARIFMEIDSLKKHVLETDLHVLDNDKKIAGILSLMEKNSSEVTQGVFCNGQIFDAYVFISNLIKKAKFGIILIDNYLDESVLLMLSKRNKDVKATIITRSVTETIAVDIAKHNKQYPSIDIVESNKFHDRFLIIDEEVYHIGASLKDLGKKLFAFSKLEIDKEILL